MSNEHQPHWSIPAIRKNSSLVIAALVTVGSLAGTGQVNAQESGAALEEIVVTSRRYEESINDAPLAVNVLDADYLEKQGVNTLSDALQLTPGATWGHYTMAQPGHTLRGIESYNSGNASLESSVQMVVDGIPITQAFMMTPPVYDMERIEQSRVRSSAHLGMPRWEHVVIMVWAATSTVV